MLQKVPRYGKNAFLGTFHFCTTNIMIFSCLKLQNVPRYIKMCYFRGSSLKTVPPACNLTRHCLLFQSVALFSRSVALFPESLLTFSKINKVRYFYQTFLFQIFNYTNLILNQLLYNSILSIFNIYVLSTYYNKCALKSSSLISDKYAGAISNTVLQPFWPSS